MLYLTLCWRWTLERRFTRQTFRIHVKQIPTVPWWQTAKTYHDPAWTPFLTSLKHWSARPTLNFSSQYPEEEAKMKRQAKNPHMCSGSGWYTIVFKLFALWFYQCTPPISSKVRFQITAQNNHTLDTGPSHRRHSQDHFLTVWKY